MLKKPITYETLDGETVTEDFYFNLSKTDLINLEASTEGGMQARIDRITKEENVAKLIVEMQSIVKLAYGVRSEDGRRFIKNEQATQEFTETPAYDTLIMELATNAEMSATFMMGILPKDLGQQIAEELATVQELPPPPPPAT